MAPRDVRAPVAAPEIIPQESDPCDSMQDLPKSPKSPATKGEGGGAVVKLVHVGADARSRPGGRRV